MGTEPTGDITDLDVVFRLVSFEGVSYDLAAPSPVMTFRENEGLERRFAIPVGVADAVTIANAAQGRTGLRPSTSELLSVVIDGLGADLVAVRFVRVEGAVVFAELDLMSAAGRRVFDCRPSDAVALALRVPSAPVLVDEVIVSTLECR